MFDTIINIIFLPLAIIFVIKGLIGIIYPKGIVKGTFAGEKEKDKIVSEEEAVKNETLIRNIKIEGILLFIIASAILVTYILNVPEIFREVSISMLIISFGIVNLFLPVDIPRKEESENQKQLSKKKKSGKLWIALGIALLVLDLILYL